MRFGDSMRALVPKETTQQGLQAAAIRRVGRSTKVEAVVDFVAVRPPIKVIGLSVEVLVTDLIGSKNHILTQGKAGDLAHALGLTLRGRINRSEP